MRNVLLLEPNYKNKYPPLGLMKIATYHRRLGDNVVFFKGELQDIILQQVTHQCLAKLMDIDSSINWYFDRSTINNFIKTRKKQFLDDLHIERSKYEFLILHCLQEYKDFYAKKLYDREPYWDRVCVSTLFTFYWDITIETILFAKRIVKNINELWVGGVMATVLNKEVEQATGIKPWSGLLNYSGILDSNDLIIDELPLDYSILEEIDYKYPENNAYYGYTTRGCIRKCDFCAVPVLEPKFCKYVSLKDKIKEARHTFGEKRNLLLLDNNILASTKFDKIIDEIKECGFIKNASYVEPNQLDIAIRNLRNGTNEIAYIKKASSLLQGFVGRLKGIQQQKFYDILYDNGLLKPETVTKERLLKAYPLLKELYEKYRNKTPKQRYVDFNQGIDARLIDEEKIKLISEIPINPLRIAFDSLKNRKEYERAIRLGSKNGIKRFSNYLLYNYDEEPLDLYYRLKINVELCEELDISIYSFPMKYHPILGEEKLSRDFIGKHWNRKFIRAVQAVLNSTKGKIGRGTSFFNKAFGNDEQEFYKILYMPETYIIYRFFFEEEGLTDEWWQDFNSLTSTQLERVKRYIEQNDFSDNSSFSQSKKIQKVLKHYTIRRDNVQDFKKSSKMN